VSAHPVALFDRVLWPPVLAYMAMLFAFSSWETPPSLTEGAYWGVHSLLYLGLGALILRALARARWTGVTALRAVAATVIAAAYGVTDEYHQSFVPGRSAEVFDLVADTAGAAAAAGGLWLWGRMKHADASHQGPSVSTR
jgi:VanZ family protein